MAPQGTENGGQPLLPQVVHPQNRRRIRAADGGRRKSIRNHTASFHRTARKGGGFSRTERGTNTRSHSSENAFSGRKGEVSCRYSRKIPRGADEQPPLRDAGRRISSRCDNSGRRSRTTYSCPSVGRKRNSDCCCRTSAPPLRKARSEGYDHSGGGNKPCACGDVCGEGSRASLRESAAAGDPATARHGNEGLQNNSRSPASDNPFEYDP